MGRHGVPQRVTRRTFSPFTKSYDDLVPFGVKWKVERCWWLRYLAPRGGPPAYGQLPVRDGTASRVRRDSNNDDLTPLGSVVPEDPVGRWRLTLCVGCKNLFALQTLQAFVFVGIETRMVQVGFHEAEGLSYRLQAFLKAFVSLKRLQLLACGRRECQRESRQVQPLIDLVVGVLSKRADLTCLTASGFF